MASNQALSVSVLQVLQVLQFFINIYVKCTYIYAFVCVPHEVHVPHEKHIEGYIYKVSY